MKLTKETLKRIIKEELETVIQEQDVLEEVDLDSLKKLQKKYKDGQISQQAYEKAKKLFYDKQGDIPDLDLDSVDDPDDKNKEKAVEKLGQVKQSLQKILNQI